jgi:hypothetical protein
LKKKPTANTHSSRPMGCGASSKKKADPQAEPAAAAAARASSDDAGDSAAKPPPAAAIKPRAPPDISRLPSLSALPDTARLAPLAA